MSGGEEEEGRDTHHRPSPLEPAVGREDGDSRRRHHVPPPSSLTAEPSITFRREERGDEEWERRGGRPGRPSSPSSSHRRHPCLTSQPLSEPTVGREERGKEPRIEEWGEFCPRPGPSGALTHPGSHTLSASGSCRWQPEGEENAWGTYNRRKRE
ncbi:hypothetical protein OsI_12511 [Oryza sativa Indica Group]|uniref:Uncharacterized protein n=1 Tax=Oryza sativa subsp. indica TaxID=39946 RepID=B8AM43_ORYSI|nr:hypothetical protein OsI_12511 [Oryza sativa Indica Group]